MVLATENTRPGTEPYSRACLPLSTQARNYAPIAPMTPPTEHGTRAHNAERVNAHTIPHTRTPVALLIVLRLPPLHHSGLSPMGDAKRERAVENSPRTHNVIPRVGPVYITSSTTVKLFSLPASLETPAPRATHARGCAPVEPVLSVTYTHGLAQLAQINW